MVQVTKRFERRAHDRVSVPLAVGLNESANSLQPIGDRGGEGHVGRRDGVGFECRAGEQIVGGVACLASEIDGL